MEFQCRDRRHFTGKTRKKAARFPGGLSVLRPADPISPACSLFTL